MKEIQASVIDDRKALNSHSGVPKVCDRR